MIAFEHVTKRYGERLALDDVSWRMDEGECACVLGRRQYVASISTTEVHNDLPRCDHAGRS